MKKHFVALLLFFFAAISAQNQPWAGYFSFNNVKDISKSGTKIVAASENAFFTKNLATNVLSTTTTIDGLSGQTISTIYYSETFNRTLIGYENGLMMIVNGDGSMRTVVDILNKQLPPDIKKINHFNEFDGIVYISCDFGIVQYNLSTLGFGDTYFIGTGPAEIVVNQTAISNGYIYAATRDYGIKRANITNPNLIDANQWSTVNSGNWVGVTNFGNEVFALTTSGQINRFNGTAFAFFNQLSEAPLDFRATNDYLIATTTNSVRVFDLTLNQLTQFNNWQIPDSYVPFTVATAESGTLYIGTSTSGVLTVAINDPNAQEFLLPAGPLRNNIFSINAATGNLWAVYGGYQSNYLPNYDLFGFSKYNADGWKHIPYTDVAPAGSVIRNLVRVTVDPNDLNHIFISSYYNGILEFLNDERVAVYNATNSELEPILSTEPPDQDIRVEQTAFDRNGNLWATEALIKDALKVRRAGGSWESFNVEGIVEDYFNALYNQMVIDKNNTVWFGSYANGVIGFNENGNIFRKITMGSDNGDLPTKNVRSIAIDKRNQLWIGTEKGLRVLPSVDRFLNDGDLTSHAIIIEDEGLAQELLYEQWITDIAVDGGNNKWIGTSDSGIFMVSPNGQETKYHFTIDNSPLPSNSINDIDINGTTGEVFIATNKGMISFKGISTNAGDNLNNVIVYPNPVRPEFAGTVKIGGLMDKATVKITDIEGNLVYEVVADGGTIEWDTTAFGKYRVASGVYMIFISAEDGTQTKVKKVMIVR